MNKITIVIALVVLILIFTNDKKIEIPKDSIRFRVIANSDTVEDQYIKKEVATSLTNDFLEVATSSTKYNIDKNINNNLPKFTSVIEQTLQKINVNQQYNINYGMNYFPEKEYKGVTYPEGEYHSLVVTLGDGLGDNFWCVLFPPLCLIETEEEQTEVEYKSFIKETIDKYF